MGLRRLLTVGLREVVEDLEAVVDRDPAARSRAEVALLYPGVHAIWAHRVSHALWRRRAKLPARALSQTSRMLTGIEIHPGAELGRRLLIDHGSGVVIGETAVVGDDVTIYHGVTLGGTSLAQGRRHPTIGDAVVIGAGAKILGAIDVGSGASVGANAVLVKSVDPQTVVVGVPGQVVAAKPEPGASTEPDPLSFAVRSLLRRVAALEEQNEDIAAATPLYRDEGGVWEPADYAI